MLGLCFIYLAERGYAQVNNRKQAEKIEKEETYTRPEPKRPVEPEIPTANRYRQDKIFLEYADSLYKLNTHDTVEKQILKGDVKFRQSGMWMYCDSAYYYPELNSIDAFGHVKMEQGDTLFAFADKMFYEGDIHLAKLKNGETEEKVRLINNDVTLTTDSLDYDLANEIGWYTEWGTIDDKVNTLTSKEGYYYTDTKDADFFKDVVLVNNQDGYTLLTDTLYYNTNTHIARIESLAEIQSENDTIITTKALYDTETGNADLLNRSTIVHRDTAGNITTLEGDSIIYDKATRISRAYMFRDPTKQPRPMVLTDTAQKTTLIGGFGIYNDSTREAMSYIYPLFMEYSTGDTLFLRADTIRTFIVTEMVDAPAPPKIPASPIVDGRPLVRVDTTGIYIDSDYFISSLPYGGYPLALLEKNKPEMPKEIQIEENPLPWDCPINFDEPSLADSGILPENQKEGNNQENTEEIIIEKEPVERKDDADVETEVNEEFVPTIQETEISGVEELPEDLENHLPDGNNNRLMEEIRNEEVPLVSIDTVQSGISLTEQIEEIEPEDTIKKVPKDFHVALAYYRARFFKSDVQGVADSIVMIERDSLMFMFRKPILWSGSRQVTGNRIDVHFNDSTADWADLPEAGMMSEHVDEDFYNQIAGKTMHATFDESSLKTLSVSGNVETIFLPQEADSTFNRLVTAESSYLELEMKNGEMEKLKMWPEVNGDVTPIFLVKRSQQYLRNFHWWQDLRPVREWYGSKALWADDLGEVPDDLEKYFLAPSDFGEPKTFSSARFTPPKRMLNDWDEMQALEADSTILSDLTIDEILEESEHEEKLITTEAEKQSEEIKEAIEEYQDSEKENSESEKESDFTIEDGLFEENPSEEQIEEESKPKEREETENQSEETQIIESLPAIDSKQIGEELEDLEETTIQETEEPENE